MALDTAIRNDHTVIVFSKDTIEGIFFCGFDEMEKYFGQSGFRLIRYSRHSSKMVKKGGDTYLLLGLVSLPGHNQKKKPNRDAHSSIS
jgi:hypothetical protein